MQKAIILALKEEGSKEINLKFSKGRNDLNNENEFIDGSKNITYKT